MSLSTKEYFVRETYKSIRRNGLMSVASVSTVTLSLLVLGMFLLLFLNTNNLAQYLESQVQITVYMQDEADGDVLEATRTKLEGLPGVEKVTPVTKEEALERFKERLGEQQNLLNSLGTDNPFPYYFEVEVDAPERIAELTPQILLVVLLAFATLFIIANTIRLTVFARRREVNIMKYVGATDWFIRWPFMLEGMTLGFFGSLISITIIDISYSALLSRIYSTLAFLPMLPPYPMLIYVDLFIIISGTAIGAAGSYVSLRKFLRV